MIPTSPGGHPRRSLAFRPGHVVSGGTACWVPLSERKICNGAAEHPQTFRHFLGASATKDKCLKGFYSCFMLLHMIHIYIYICMFCLLISTFGDKSKMSTVLCLKHHILYFAVASMNSATFLVANAYQPQIANASLPTFGTFPGGY